MGDGWLGGGVVVGPLSGVWVGGGWLGSGVIVREGVAAGCGAPVECGAGGRGKLQVASGKMLLRAVTNKINLGLFIVSPLKIVLSNEC